MIHFLLNTPARQKTRRHPRARVALALALTVACAFGMLAPGDVRGEDKPSELPPEVAPKFNDFFKKFADVRRKQLDKNAGALIAEVVKVTGLDAGGVETLKTAAAKAEDAEQADLEVKMRETLTKAYRENGAAILQFLAMPNAVEMNANSDEMDADISFTHAADQPAWKEALAHTLTPAQAAAWEKAHAKPDEEALRAINNYLDAHDDQMREQLKGTVTRQKDEIIAALALPEPRAAALAALATKAVDASLAAGRKHTTDMLLKEDKVSRERRLKARGWFYSNQSEDAPEDQAVWKDGLARLLTDEDRTRLAAAREKQKTRRVHVLGQLMLALLDEKIAFTSGERPRLEPIAERLVQKRKEFFPEPGQESQYNTFNPASFYQVSAEARPEELHAILDDIQCKRWQALKEGKPADSEDDEAVPTPPPTPTPAPDAVGEPEDLEQAVADYLQFHTALHRREIESDLTLRTEDATRVAGLSPANAARLQTAARGTAEAAIDAWLPDVEQTVRSAVQGATRESMQARLGSVSSYYFRQNFDPSESETWKAALAGELTAPQRAAWDQERAARTAYHGEAVGQLLTEEFDREVGLSTEQWQKAQAMIVKAFQEYQGDIEGMFSFSNSTPWFLSSYYMFLPLHGIPEADLKALLTKEQWDHWSASSGYANSASYWDNVKQNHESRLKREKEREEKEKADQKAKEEREKAEEKKKEKEKEKDKKG